MVEKALAKRGGGELGPHGGGEVPLGGGHGEALMVTPEYVESTKISLALLQNLVRQVLVHGRDYGRVPGIPDFLWDPGAALIIGAFNSHAGQRRILHLTNTEEKISVVLEVPIISNASQAEVGSGVGAASTSEVKHKYRWVTNPSEWGYSEEATRPLKTRKDSDKPMEYRILNPEPEELLNTMIKMASKRAEVDAAEALPGVGSTLKELFSGRQPRRTQPEAHHRAQGGAEAPRGPRAEETPNWTKFWSEVRALGLTQDEAHQRLNVGSMVDWLSAGKSLDDAIRVFSGQKPEGAQVKPRSYWDQVTEAMVASWDDLERIMVQCANLQPDAMYKELGNPSFMPWEAFLELKEKLAPAPEQPRE